MIGVLWALMAAAGFGFSNIFVRLGLQFVSPSRGTFISLLSSLLLSTTVTVLWQLDALLSIPLVALGWFAIAGILNFPVGRFFKFLGIRYLGTTRATAVASASPLFSIILAVLLIGERINPPILAGALFIVVGLYLLAKEQRE